MYIFMYDCITVYVSMCVLSSDKASSCQLNSDSQLHLCDRSKSPSDSVDLPAGLQVLMRTTRRTWGATEAPHSRQQPASLRFRGLKSYKGFGVRGLTATVVTLFERSHMRLEVNSLDAGVFKLLLNKHWFTEPFSSWRELLKQACTTRTKINCWSNSTATSDWPSL